MISDLPLAHTVSGHIKAKTLRSFDAVVVLSLIHYMDKTTGLVDVTSAKIAEDTGKSAEEVSRSIRRLKDAVLIALWKNANTGAHYLMFNPSFAIVGGHARRAMAYQRWEEATA